MECKNEYHSDDDFDCSNNSFSDNNQNSGYSSNNSQRQSGTHGMSKAELRKTNKPIMEKRRRARINHCLNELKSLILEAMKKDPARHTKLEKADILEMTVKHLQSVQRQQLSMAIQTDPSVIHKFKTGFVECAEEVNRYVSQLDGIDAGVRQRLTQHLSGCATSLEQIGSMSTFNNGYRGAAPANLFGVAPTASGINPAAALFPPNGMAQDLNNNNNGSSNQPGAPIQMGGVQLIPSRLPSGEFALIMPNSHTAPGSLLNTTPSAAQSAFAAWPQVGNSTGSVTATNQINDFASNFKRMSAFTKPLQAPLLPQPPATASYPGTQMPPKMPPAFHQPSNCLAQNSSTTTSPPLSPISSVSSHGDDSSMMHTSSEFGPSRPATPPQDSHLTGGQHNFSGVFSTPSSAESSLTLSLTNTSATSTSSSSVATPLSLHLQQQQVSSTSGCESGSKRSLNTSQETAAADSSDSSDEPTAKRFAAASKKGLDFDETERDSMWRPW